MKHIAMIAVILAATVTHASARTTQGGTKILAMPISASRLAS
ncbi:hypothetical protein J2848_004088 [Azospirillum lipoferum]|nr:MULTISPECIES: hypothetical protein [Azospirillum]MCP1612397.1 hypothetical protein [Azospirillum lipoferum]MDW5531819.1 hypothetical protein [Azospirillum sp. NL1]